MIDPFSTHTHRTHTGTPRTLSCFRRGVGCEVYTHSSRPAPLHVVQHSVATVATAFPETSCATGQKRLLVLRGAHSCGEPDDVTSLCSVAPLNRPQ